MAPSPRIPSCFFMIFVILTNAKFQSVNYPTHIRLFDGPTHRPAHRAPNRSKLIGHRRLPSWVVPDETPDVSVQRGSTPGGCSLLRPHWFRDEGRCAACRWLFACRGHSAGPSIKSAHAPLLDNGRP